MMRRSYIPHRVNHCVRIGKRHIRPERKRNSCGVMRFGIRKIFRRKIFVEVFPISKMEERNKMHGNPDAPFLQTRGKLVAPDCQQLRLKPHEVQMPRIPLAVRRELHKIELPERFVVPLDDLLAPFKKRLRLF